MAKTTDYYCVGFFWYGSNPENQLPRFYDQGVWQNGFEDKYLDKVKSVAIGSKIAAKTSYTRKKDGKIISVLEVHGIGTVTANQNDGKTLKVDWDKNFKSFVIDGRGAYRSTISKVNTQENIDIIFGGKKKSETDALSFNAEDLQVNHPLNQILFGPPGTGKTYHTINKAVAIIDGIKESSLNHYYEERSDLKDRFDELFIDDWDNPIGQIGFITFHQSMSYEDFIEGIKPIVTDNKNVIYDTIPGILKNMCSFAKDNWLDANKGIKGELSFEDAFSKFKDEWEENQTMKFPLKTPGKDYTIYGFSKSSISFKKSTGNSSHTLSISSLRDYYYKNREIRQHGLGIYYPSLIDKLRTYQPSLIIEKEEKRYVLIIDEINRGNVSQIFGELITLIEDDKRLGNDEALELTLPYSKEKFGVPPNLYIIGTMNTADRSVEALDAALRRRFSFEEMPPKPELIETDGKTSTGFIHEINLAELLRTINKRLEILLDKDHQIGHSYFLSVSNLNELKKAFQNKIIPLLQEYFFGDYGKIGLVLGNGFVTVSNYKQDKLFADFSKEYDATEYAERLIYRIENIALMDDVTFEMAIKNLINN